MCFQRVYTLLIRGGHGPISFNTLCWLLSVKAQRGPQWLYSTRTREQLGWFRSTTRLPKLQEPLSCKRRSLHLPAQRYQPHSTLSFQQDRLPERRRLPTHCRQDRGPRSCPVGHSSSWSASRPG